MSIPPLVCSTPPPPDQCEDDKDPEYFDLSYNLSQDEDDDDENNDYSYGNFTPYNNFQPAPNNHSLEHGEQEITTHFASELPKEIILNYENIQELEHNITRHNDITIHNIIEDKLKCEDDLNIEDLNLTVDEEIESIVEQNEVTEESVEIVKDFNIPCDSNNDSPTCDTTNSPTNESAIESVCDAPKEKNSDFVTSEPELSIDIPINADQEDNNSKIVLQDDNLSTMNELCESVKLKESLNPTDTECTEQSPKDIDSEFKENITIDDDYSDFDDFQSVNIVSNVTSVVENSVDPWGNAATNESDFGDFTANFEEFQSVNLAPADTASTSVKLERLESETKDVVDEKLSDDDDFGDFDDFKSSATKTQSNDLTESLQSDDLPVFNLHLTENEHQILERIANVLSSVFIEEISDPEDGFDSKLESLLSETWGHLMETDERQPYIVNWNNSFGQKSLLRALCIDSRNILFGPKWSSHMPKYAANLSNAPLQPQKQASAPSSIITQNEVVTEKPSSKPTSWGDPFTSDGQESCNTENESAAITPVPTDLNVFEAALTTKPEKIFSNTIGVQPLRQINLPDTHIFTPTDSEIPRSKTIHYDLGPTVLLPQSPLEDNKNKTDTRSIPSSSNQVENNNDVDNNEYWEFQNFKGSSDTSSLPGTNSHVIPQEKSCETATVVNALPQPSIAYQTELLQPIKIQPAMPTLNWPDPGEVKGVFDDFSDFVSMSSQPIQKQDSTSIPVEFQSGIENAKQPNVNVLEDNALPEPSTSIKGPTNDGFDDDFNTFQSALPSKSTGDNFDSVSSINQVPPSNLFSVNSKVDSFKSDSISFTSIPRPNEALNQNLGHTNRSELTTNKNVSSLASNIQTNLLQPTPINFSSLTTQSKQKSGQILQPLSLESYSQINWPSPGIDLQDLSRFNPVETLHSLKSDLSVNSTNKGSPAHTNQVSDDDVWGEFVSSKPKQPLPSQPKKPSNFVDDDEWTDFISSPSVKPQNGLNTISLNVHTNSNIHKSIHNKFAKKPNQPPVDIPTLNYITPKSNPHKSYNDKHFQNL